MALVEASRASSPGAASWTLSGALQAHPVLWLLAVFLLVLPAFASNFVLIELFGWAMILGMIALSLMFLAGYGGMVSLVQMSVAGCAGYMVAIFGTSVMMDISLGWPWWVGVPLAIIIAVIFGTLSGVLAVRTEGIYTIMITLAIGVAFYYLTQQNYEVFNGFNGFPRVLPPTVFDLYWRDPRPYYYLALGVAALCFCFVLYVRRSTFGIALQGIRDNPRRMRALGFNVTAHRIAAYAVAGFIASLGGILFTWFNGRISPGSIGIGPLINILVIAVLGGMRHPIGPFIGAVVFVLLQNFAIDLVDRERFNMLIGTIFLAVVLFSPDGLLGLWRRLRTHFSARHL
jgi:branched-chain amino acid transport system permease protein